MEGQAPLEGISIVEWASEACSSASALAIALAGRIAADLGADVLQVETPGVQVRRTAPPLVNGMGALAHFVDRNKMSVEAIPQDFSPTIILSDATNSALDDWRGKSSLVIVADRAHAPAAPDSEFTLLAASGLLDIVGDPARQPLRLGGHQLAYAAGLSLYTAMVAEVARRRAGGAPDVARVNIADVAVWLNWKSAALGGAGGRVPTRLGDGAEWRTIRCKDGWVALVYLEADWAPLKAVVKDPRLNDPRYDDRMERRRDAARINAIVEEAFAGRTREELRVIALDHRIPLGPVWTPAELEADPQYVARDFLRRLPGPGSTATLQPLLPVQWNGLRFGTGATRGAAS